MNAKVEELEPELEELLLKIVPDLSAEWEGAPESEVDRIEEIAGRPLPRCYRWFLLRMGRNMGRLTYPRLDFSAKRVLSSYRDALFEQHPRFLMIGYDTDDEAPTHLFYDFEHSVRNDARIVGMEIFDTDFVNRFETLREMIAWGQFLAYRVNTMPVRCSGILEDSEGDVLSRLRPLIQTLGFTTPVDTGDFCAIYDSSDVAMVSSTTPGEAPEFHYFDFGGPDTGRLRKVLGAISDQTSLEVEIDEWEPPDAD